MPDKEACEAARAMLAALKEFRMFYPHGINPNLDEAYAMAGDAIAQAEAAGITITKDIKDA